MRKLLRLGCGVALDDFGTGFVFTFIPSPVAGDGAEDRRGSFVRDVLKDVRAESMVQAIAQLARSMSLITVAEYVETEELRHRIAALGVDYGQGFAIGRPVPLQEVLAELPMIAAAAPIPRSSDEHAHDLHQDVAAENAAAVCLGKCALSVGSTIRLNIVDRRRGGCSISTPYASGSCKRAKTMRSAVR